jgi:hypothetical protein
MLSGSLQSIIESLIGTKVFYSGYFHYRMFINTYKLILFYLVDYFVKITPPKLLSLYISLSHISGLVIFYSYWQCHMLIENKHLEIFYKEILIIKKKLLEHFFIELKGRIFLSFRANKQS